MLREVPVTQDQPGLTRRLFTSEQLELYVWLDAAGAVASFQLAYDGAPPRVVQYRGDRVFHARLDSGNADAQGYTQTDRASLMLGDASPVPPELRELLRAESAGIPAAIAHAVLQTLAA